MVKPSVKRKINKGKEIYISEIINYINYLTQSSESRIDFWRRDTANYILNNFGIVLSNMDITDFNGLLLRCLDGSQTSKLILGAANKFMDNIVEILNNGTSQELFFTIQHIEAMANPEDLFGGKLAQFYEKIDRDKFDFSYLIRDNYRNSPFKEKMREEYMEVLANATKTGRLHPSDVSKYIVELKKDEKGLQFLRENATTLMAITDTPIEVLSLLDNVDIDREEVNMVANQRLDAIVKEMLGQVQPLKVKDSVESRQVDIRETVKMMLQELLKNEKCEPCEIRKITKGGFSSVFGIGDKVVKIGNTPGTYQIPKTSRRFLQPLVRYLFDSCDNEGKDKKVNIEILERCNTKIPATEEELYNIYKELRQSGMIWTDAKRDNVGRLTKSNRVHFDGIEGVHPPNLGFVEHEPVEVLEPGEWVIIDLDFIYDENDPKIKWPGGGSASDDFERRYQNELEIQRRRLLRANNLEQQPKLPHEEKER